MTLLSVCQNALEELGGFDVPTTFVGSNLPTSKSCVALLRTAGRQFVRNNGEISALISTHTFSTVDGTANYALPSDFKSFALESQWDRTDDERLLGPQTAKTWQRLKSSGLDTTVSYNWRLQGGYIYLHPTPSDVHTIAFDYYSKNWVIKQSDSSEANDLYSDQDTFRLDETFLTLELKWRFLQSKGMPFEVEHKEALLFKSSYLVDLRAAQTVDLSGPSAIVSNVPEGNWDIA